MCIKRFPRWKNIPLPGDSLKILYSVKSLIDGSVYLPRDYCLGGNYRGVKLNKIMLFDMALSNLL